ncbi:hypothetical protein evm_001337 [Chilo suppressalis]|nr:hypothetical protein evm_001337 [Chilo suppressalis]
MDGIGRLGHDPPRGPSADWNLHDSPTLTGASRWGGWLARLAAIVEVKQLSQWSVIGWVTKNLLSRVLPYLGRHVKPLVPAASSVVSTRQSALGPRVYIVVVVCDTTELLLKAVNTAHVLPARIKRDPKMTTKGKRPMRALTPGDKIEAIQRVNDGESKASVARDIGVPESTLRGWCKNEDKLRYMTSRLSSPDTDKSNDGEPPDKRARTESPAAPQSPVAGLDLTAPAPATTHTPHATTPDAPVELTTKRAEPSPPTHVPRERRPDPGASVSMSAISPLSGLGHIPGLTHSHLGLSFNEIATNLTLLAQLNPGLSALSAQPASRALRSVRSPKPAHNGGLNLNEVKHRSKSHHHSDPYRSSVKSSHHSTPTTTASQPVDDTLWYWLKTQQAMLDLTAQTTTAHSLQLGKTDSSIPVKPVTPAAPINSHLDYNRNSWLWQYYKQFGGAMALPEDKLRSASQVPKEKAAENILYSQLTKGKADEERSTTSLVQSTTQLRNEEVRETSNKEPRVAEPAASPEIGVENKEPLTEKSHESSRSHTKARTVLDNLLFNNNNQPANAESGGAESGGWEAGAAEALEHGDKFLAWLESSGDPSVTRMHVHQLRALLHNLRSRRVPHTTHVPIAPHAPHVPHAPPAPQLAELEHARRK